MEIPAALERHRDRVRLMQIQALNVSYLAFNLRKAPTDKRLVREALDIAVDRDAIFRALFPRGDAMQAVSAFPPAIPGYNKKLKNEFDPAKANALLDLFARMRSEDCEKNKRVLAERLGIGLGVRIGECSKGMRQKIAIIQALMHEPELLILDEPTNNLDPASVEALGEMLRSWKGTIVAVSHERGFVEALEPTHAVLLPEEFFDLWRDDYLDLVEQR